MTSPDSNEDVTSGKYNVQIGEGKGVVVGGNPPMDLMTAEATYRQNVVDAYKWLNFSGFDTPDLSLANVPLEEVFVHLTLTVEKVIRESISPGTSGQTQQRGRVITVQEPIELDQALGNHLLIVGEPGAGKSTLLRWLAVTFAEARQRETHRVGPSADSDRLPVLVELGRLSDRYLKPEGGEAPNWLQLLPEYLTSQLAFTHTPPQLLTQALTTGRCLLLFDGLDEIADRQTRSRFARSLAELARLPLGNRVIMGSRPAGVSQSDSALRPLFRRCQIERFTPDDVRRFFRFWYALDRGLTPAQQRDAADALFARVQATPATLQLASTPLISTILLLIWRNEGDLPEHRTELYERCCRLLIERWEVSHDVAYQGMLVGMDWEDHLRLLMPLAYAIHSQEQRTNATREELVPLLAQALQAAGYANEQAAATREAKHFLDALGLRSGLLQYMGEDRYGFPHQTFQEYLAARYIAAQPDPDYIDLVMAHLNEAWWQEVHLLTIAYLGSRIREANKSLALILTILRVYAPPSWIFRSSNNPWLPWLPGKLFPQVQLERRIAWILARELELVLNAYDEYEVSGAIATILSVRAVSLVRSLIYRADHYNAQISLLTVACRFLQRQGSEAGVKVLLEALHDPDWRVRENAAKSLGQVGGGSEKVVMALLEVSNRKLAEGFMTPGVVEGLGQVGVGNEKVVRVLLHTLYDKWGDVRDQSVKSLGQVGAGNQEVVKALLATLHDADPYRRAHAAVGLGEVGAGNQEVVEALLEALRDEHSAVRRDAAESLGQMGVGNEKVVRALMKTLYDTDQFVQWRSALSLGKIGAGNQEVVKVLLEALHNVDKDVRQGAAGGLGEAGVSNQEVVEALLETLHDPEDLVRGHAAESLGKIGTGNQEVVKALLEALHDPATGVQENAARSLGLVGTGNQETIEALLEALHDKNSRVRQRAATSLGLLEIKDAFQLRQVLVALNRCLYDLEDYYDLKDYEHEVDYEVRQAALVSIRQLLDGRPISGYRWVPLRKRRAQKRQLKRIVFWLGMTAFIVLIGLAVTWLLGILNPNGFPVRFLAVLAGIIAFIAAIAQVLGRTLRDPWDHS